MATRQRLPPELQQLLQTRGTTPIEEANPYMQHKGNWLEIELFDSIDTKTYKSIQTKLGMPKKAFNQLRSEIAAICALEQAASEWEAAGRSFDSRGEWFSKWFPPAFFTRWANAFNIPAQSVAFQKLIFQTVLIQNRSGHEQHQASSIAPTMQSVSNTNNTGSATQGTHAFSSYLIDPQYAPASAPEFPATISENGPMFCFKYKTHSLLVYLSELCPANVLPSIAEIDLGAMMTRIQNHFKLRKLSLELRCNGLLDGTHMSYDSPFQRLAQYALKKDPHEVIMFKVLSLDTPSSQPIPQNGSNISNNNNLNQRLSQNENLLANYQARINAMPVSNRGNTHLPSNNQLQFNPHLPVLDRGQAGPSIQFSGSGQF